MILFGTQQVFGKKSTTYTTLLILRKSSNKEFNIEIVIDLQTWKLGTPGVKETFPKSQISKDRWVFIIRPFSCGASVPLDLWGNVSVRVPTRLFSRGPRTLSVLPVERDDAVEPAVEFGKDDLLDFFVFGMGQIAVTTGGVGEGHDKSVCEALIQAFAAGIGSAGEVEQPGDFSA